MIILSIYSDRCHLDISEAGFTRSISYIWTENNVFQFYIKRPIATLPIESFETIKTGNKRLFFANQKTMALIRAGHVEFTLVKAFPNYKNETILPAFINKRTRASVVDSVYLISK